MLQLSSMFNAVDQLLAEDVSSQLLTYLTVLSEASPLPIQCFFHNLLLHHHSSSHLPLSQLCSIVVWGPNSNSSSISPCHWPVGQCRWGAFRSPSVHASAPSCNCTLDPSHEVWFLLLTWSNCIKRYIIARLMNIFTTVAAKFSLLIEYTYY